MSIAIASLLLVLAQGSAETVPPRIDANANRSPAGQLRGGVLRVQLEARLGRWYPKSDNDPSEIIQAFAEVGHRPLVPGPLIRVRVGTQIAATIRNTLAEPLVVYGFHSRPGVPADTLRIAPGASRDVRFLAGAPGTYFYWASSSGRSIEERTALESQLSGAIVVDPTDGPASPRDRVFVLGAWSVLKDTTGPKPWFTRDEMVINGKSYPYTEPLTHTVGDTVRWRWINATADGHPMHLHGFYYSVNSRGTWSADTLYRSSDRRQVVTELLTPGQTMTATWVPSTPGNWLFHCHFAFHVSHFLSFNLVPDPVDPGAPDAVDHSVHGMMGLVLGIRIDPGARRQAPEIRKDIRGKEQIPRSARDDSKGARDDSKGARDDGEDVARSRPRAIRLLVQTAPARYGSAPGYGFVAQETPAAIPDDSVPVLSPTLMLRRGEPVRITVVNHLRAPTAVHWHGIELADSYYDGVPGWSGAGAHLAPAIAPRDSFVAELTPPRAGTFIYHSHSNEEHQIASGLYGALIVLEPGRVFDPTTDRIFVIGKDGPLERGGRVNGQKNPAEQTLVAGKTYRFRIVEINPDSRVFVSVMADSAVQRWRPVAKDGADLPASQAVTVPAILQMGPGETADFEFTPLAPGGLRLEVAARTDGWRMSVPLRVVRP